MTYKLALLHLVHTLAHADGVVTDHEKQLLKSIREEEQISEPTFQAFEASLASTSEKNLYDRGMQLLASCTEDQKLQVFAYLYKLALIDNNLNMREVRLLFYALKLNHIEFDDIVLVARMAS